MLKMTVIAFLVILAHYYCCLSHFGCYTKITHTRWFKQHLYVIVLEAGKFKIKAPWADWYLVRACFLVHSSSLSKQKEGGRSLGSLL